MSSLQPRWYAFTLCEITLAGASRLGVIPSLARSAGGASLTLCELFPAVEHGPWIMRQATGGENLAPRRSGGPVARDIHCLAR